MHICISVDIGVQLSAMRSIFLSYSIKTYIKNEILANSQHKGYPIASLHFQYSECPYLGHLNAKSFRKVTTTNLFNDNKTGRSNFLSGNMPHLSKHRHKHEMHALCSFTHFTLSKLSYIFLQSRSIQASITLPQVAMNVIHCVTFVRDLTWSLMWRKIFHPKPNPFPKKKKPDTNATCIPYPIYRNEANIFRCWELHTACCSDYNFKG